MSDVTERLLVDAGIESGMRVLDVGCGHGDVSFLLAAMVGAQGHVLGIDHDAGAVARARARASAQGVSNVAFVQGDMGAQADAHGDFDAVVGRRVLMYQPDPVAVVRSLGAALRPGGLVVFQENDTTMGPASIPPLPLHERVHWWIWRTVEREGADLHMGFHLAGVLARAGLVVEQVRAEAIVHTSGSPSRTGSIVRAMLPRIVGEGVATAAEIDVETLDERLAAELAEGGATFVGEMVFGAWARKPA